MIENNSNDKRSRSGGENKSSLEAFEPKSSSAAHLAYIEKHWEVFAAIAWKEFNAHGRGALVLQPETGCAGETDWDCVFIPVDMLQCQPQLQDYVKMVRLYVPATDLVAIFLTPPDSVSAYRGTLVPERIAPPEAYEKLAPVLNLT